MPLVAGVDCSTQATKVLVVDAEDGTVAATGRAPHEVHGEDGARETDPRVWWQALGSALAQTGMADQVAAISVAGQQHGLVVTDVGGEPLRPAPLWNDTRAAPDAAALIEDMGGAGWWAREVGSVPVASFTVAKWAWLRRTEPELAAAVARIRLPHDWLTERLSGAGVTDRGDASGTGWWSPRRAECVEEVLSLDRILLDRELLPKVVPPEDPVGTVTRAAAEELGLPGSALVAAGTGDNMGAALGLGLEAGTPVVSLGTSGTAYAVSTSPTADETGTVAGFADGADDYLPLAATLNCTVAVDRVAAWLDIDRNDVADATSVTVLPYLDGERTPNLPNASGSITGLRHDTTKQEILLAAYEGAAFSLLRALDSIDRLGSGLTTRAPLLLIGGGAQGHAWRRVMGRLSGRTLVIPDAGELVALGAAVQAAAVSTGGEVRAVADAWNTRRGVTLEPQERDHDRLAAIEAAVVAAGG